MYLTLLGLNHNSAPIDIREQFAIQEDQYNGLYLAILSKDVSECCIISTCNRVEFYIFTDDDVSKETFLEIIEDAMSVDKNKLAEHSYHKSGREAIEHIFSVASGLDSLVVGEPQVLGQVKDAFQRAKDNFAISTFMLHLQDYTLKIAKKVRTDTGICNNPVSVSYAAVELAKKIFDNLKSASALIIGAGEMCELAIKHFITSEIGSIVITNRTYEKAVNLASEYNARAIEFDKFTEALEEVDIVISSTGADHFIITHDRMASIMNTRKHKPLFIIDIAVPRDIDPEIAKIDNIYLYDIDDLKQIVESNKKNREKEAKKAQEIIDVAINKFYKSVEVIKINPVLKDMKDFFISTKDNELKKYLEKNKIENEDEIAKLDTFMSSVINKQLHNLFTNIKTNVDSKKIHTLADAAKIIFNQEEIDNGEK